MPGTPGERVGQRFHAHPFLSPDRKWIYYTEVVDGFPQVCALEVGDLVELDDGWKEVFPMSQMPRSFPELLKTADKPILVDFWAPWCGPCRAVSQAIEQIAREFSSRMITIKINVDQKPEIARQYQISSIPTIMLFWRGEPVMRLLGAQPAEQIRREIERHWPAG